MRIDKCKEIRWIQDTPLEIVQNSKLVLDYFNGKLQNQTQNKDGAQVLISKYHQDQTQFYYFFLGQMQVWKAYWYFSPLYRPVHKLFDYLSPIKFPHLTKLVINQSSIYSIEPISWLSCPVLRQIDIQQNYIVSLKPLCKTNFPSLIVLKFYYNNFNHGQGQNISRTRWIKFHQLGLYHFCRQLFYDQYFKLQPNNLQKMYVQRARDETLNNRKIVSKLQQKFIVPEFYVHFSKL